MLHVRVIAPDHSRDRAVDAIRDDPTIANVIVIEGAALEGRGHLIMFDVARENANPILGRLRHLGITESGSIALGESMTILGAAGDLAEKAAPGHPSDGVVWEEIEDRARDDARMSWSFLAFLILATLIAGVGRYLDQTILIIGAMVVGPEFAPLSAICIAIVRRQPRLLRPAAVTLFGGFAVAATIAWLLWSVANLIGLVDATQATTGSATGFIVKPDVWSFIIALLAGCAGILSLTSAKSSALVGVFISITTVPAVATIGLTLAVGEWAEAGASAIQLAVNLLGLLVSGIITLAVQSVVSRPPRRSRGKGEWFTLAP